MFCPSKSLPVIGRLGAVEVGDSDGDGFVVDGERPHAAVVHRRRLEVVPDKLNGIKVHIKVILNF